MGHSLSKLSLSLRRLFLFITRRVVSSLSVRMSVDRVVSSTRKGSTYLAI